MYKEKYRRKLWWSKRNWFTVTDEELEKDNKIGKRLRGLRKLGCKE